MIPSRQHRQHPPSPPFTDLWKAGNDGDDVPSSGSSPAQPYVHNNQSANTNVVLIGAASPPTVITQTVLTPPNYLGWSIFNFLCCFWPLGLAAIIFSCKVGSARSPEEARRNSMTARNLNIAATVIAPVLAAIIVGAVMGSAATAVVAG